MGHTTGIFIIHGTFGHPLEYASLVTVLVENGYHTRSVSLPGHGETMDKSLQAVSAQEMLDHCLADYLEFAQQCDSVFILGHSLGGICALLTAATQPEKLQGTISLSAPYEHAFFVNRPWGFFQMPVAHLVPGLMYIPQGCTGLKSPDFSPWWFPKLYQEARLLLTQLQTRLPDLSGPVMLAHSPYDLIVPYGEMAKIAQRINRPHQVQSVTLDLCGHQIYPDSCARDFTTQLILDFIFQHQAVPTAIKA